jgi:transposase-like protein
MHPAIRQNSTDSDTNTNLSPAQAQVIAALAQGRTITAAARETDVHRSTIYNWLEHEPQFKTAVENARREYVEILSDGMRDLATAALDTLRRLLEDRSTPHAVRLRAALAILQRPHFPDQGWHLPERIEPMHQQKFLDDLAEVQADYNAVRAIDAIEAAAKPKEPAEPAPIARCAPCPCGSGAKYKRCCGAASAGKFTRAPGVAA